MARKQRLGEMLVEAGLMTEHQLMSALADQKQSNLKLGTVCYPSEYR